MLARLALRLAAIEALAPSALATTGPWPTPAGPRVYDSRQDVIDGLDQVESRPILIVYTEETESDPAGSGRSRPDSVIATLVVECMVAAKGLVEYEQPDGTTVEVGTLEAPIMDRRLEALIDNLEAIVIRRLQGRAVLDPAIGAFRKVATEIRSINSVPTRDASRTVRLAARTLSIKIKIPADEWSEPSFSAQSSTGLDLLPEPLRSVANALPVGSDARALCVAVAASISSVSPVAPLAGVSIYAAHDRLPTANDADVKASVITPPSP